MIIFIPGALRTAQDLASWKAELSEMDVRFLELGGEAYLSGEALGRQARCHRRREHFNHDVPPERYLVRHEHSAHSSTRELALDGVGSAQRFLELYAQHAGGGVRVR